MAAAAPDEAASRAAARERKKWKHEKGCSAQRREGVSSADGCRGPECDFAYFLGCRPRALCPNGDGAPPQAHIHLNLEVYTSGSPRTKFGPKCNDCNRHPAPIHTAAAPIGSETVVASETLDLTGGVGNVRKPFCGYNYSPECRVNVYMWKSYLSVPYP